MFITEKAPSDAGTGQPASAERAAPAAAVSSPATPATAPVLVRLTDPAWLFATVWRGRMAVLACGLAGAVLAGLASLTVPPRYVATTQLFIDPRDLRVLQNEVSPQTVGSDPTTTVAYLESQARIIASDTIKTKVIEREKLESDPEFGGEPPSALTRLLRDLGLSASEADDSRLALALGALDRRLTVRRGERTFVIDIAVASRDPAKSARIANALANTYLDDQTQVRADAANRATAALTSRLEELRNRLRKAEEKAEKYKEANNIVGAGGKLIDEEQLSLNNGQLVALRTRVTEARAKLDQIRATRASEIEAGAIPEAVASNTMTALRAQLGAALNKEADLVASLGPRHPGLVAAQAQVRDARRQIAEELARISTAARNEYDRAVQSERQISARVEGLKGTQVNTSRALVELRELEREVESSRVVYDAFLRRARETDELSGIDTTNARIIGFALPPLERTGLSRKLLAMAGGFGGLMLGAFGVIGMALITSGSRRGGAPAPLPASQAAPIAAETLPVPFRPEPEEKRQSWLGAFGRRKSPEGAPNWRRFTAIEGGQGKAETPAGAPSPAKPTDLNEAPLLATLPGVGNRRWRKGDAAPRSVFQGGSHLVDVLDRPSASFAKAMRGLLAALPPAETGRTGHRSLLILPLRPGSGATTVALNLALAAAEAGRVPLLVDAGLGAEGLTPVHAPRAEAGLGEIVSGAAGLIRVALCDEGTGTHFLPRHGDLGRLDPQTIKSGFLDAARRFDPVVIDGAALGTDPLTHAFAAVVDDIVLVVRDSGMQRGAIAEAAAILGANAAKIRGFVLNEV